MCTVSFVPTPLGFAFTSNRDEHISRANTLFPASFDALGELVQFPKDPEANGSWIAFSSTRIVCLLNGGFEKHLRTAPYRKSRGLIVLERFEHLYFEDFVKEVDLNNIEPFTLISLERLTPEAEWKIVELVWDGSRKHVTSKNNLEKHIWSSSTLYNKDIRNQRAQLFSSEDPKTPFDVWNLHEHGGTQFGPSDQFKMKRANGLETISTTQITKNNHQLNVRYKNYTLNEQFKLAIQNYTQQAL